MLGNMNTSIKNWPEQERPRERLLQQGPQSLSDAELLAIFLRSGSRQHSAVELSRLLIQHFGSLNAVFDSSLSELTQFNGIGATKYSQLLAVKELGRRYLDHHFQKNNLSLHTSDLVLDYLRYELKGEKQEVFAVLCLDPELRKLHFKKLFLVQFNIVRFQSIKPYATPYSNMLANWSLHTIIPLVQRSLLPKILP